MSQITRIGALVMLLAAACSVPESEPSTSGPGATASEGAATQPSVPLVNGTTAVPGTTGGVQTSPMSSGAVPGASAGGVPSSVPSDSDTTAPSSGAEPSPSGEASTATGSSSDPSVVPPTSTDEEYEPPLEPPPDEDGSQLWLRYPKVTIPGRLAEYQAAFTHIVGGSASPTLQAVQAELVRGLSGLVGADVAIATEPQPSGAVVYGTPADSPIVAGLADRLGQLGSDGYLVEASPPTNPTQIVVAANSERGVLYGAFALLRHLQMHRSLVGLSLNAAPKIRYRVLDHWDNLDGSVERGYSGRSLWDWAALPETLSPRYQDYARANASIGVNGTVLNNVNANAQILTPQYLDKVAALADVFRAYGIAVYLTARFSAPIEIGGLSSADPLAADVQQWWADKATEIYDRIPDFGGFLVKANSEGQPGPRDYERTHAEGANMLADALAPHGGSVMWRAFVYSEASPTDRIRQAYEEFQPLDGKFRDNVFVQVKNGPLDFQPREPFSPLFGAMPNTPLSLELQVTKEYLGQDTHLAYLGPLYEEVLQSDTFAKGVGSTVARVVDGTLHGASSSAIAGVANIGSDVNWTGSLFNQANWYVFGRMAWDPDSSAEVVADEWVRQTLSNDPVVVMPVTAMMMASRQALVNYMTPLGLAHIMGTSHHYGPAPWVADQTRPEWNPTYYHRADEQGIGFDRTASGSKALDQYFEPVRAKWGDRATVPDDLLLFFHHVGWTEKLASGRTLWDELVYRYSLGVDAVATLRESWAGVQGLVDEERFDDVAGLLQIQHWEARWWRDACLQYFEQFAAQPLSDGYAAPAHDLTFYRGLTCPADATRARCDAIYTGEPSPAIAP